MSTPDSEASRKLTTDVKPACLSQDIASGEVAPPHPTVASTRLKLRMPVTASLVTVEPGARAATS